MIIRTTIHRHLSSLILAGLFSAVFCLPVSSFQNPISQSDKPDPCVYKWMGRYYLFATNDLSWNRSILKSDDAVTWTPTPLTALDVPDSFNTWAPDVFYYNGLFYLYTSGWAEYPNEKQQAFAATSLTGPYVLRVDGLVVSDPDNLDGSVFVDDNGQAYFTYSSSGALAYRQMQTPLWVPTPSNDLPNLSVLGGWTEAPQILKIGTQYYSVFSGTAYTDPSYQVWAGKSSSSIGSLDLQPSPYHIFLAHPCYDPNCNYCGTGHNYIFRGPDLRTYYTAYHIIDKARTAQLGYTYRVPMIDKVYVGTSNNLRCDGPTLPPTAVPNPQPPSYSYRSFDAWLRQSGSWTVNSDAQLLEGDTKITGVSDSWDTQTRLVCNVPCQPGSAAVSEFNLKLESVPETATNPTFGVFVRGNGPGDYFPYAGLYVNFVRLSAVDDTWAVVCGVSYNGLVPGAINWPMPNSFTPVVTWKWNPRSWHTIRIEENLSKNKAKIFVDGLLRANMAGLALPGAGPVNKLGFCLTECTASYAYTAYGN
jgi:hypothetical protein